MRRRCIIAGVCRRSVCLILVFENVQFERCPCSWTCDAFSKTDHDGQLLSTGLFIYLPFFVDGSVCWCTLLSAVVFVCGSAVLLARWFASYSIDVWVFASYIHWFRCILFWLDISVLIHVKLNDTYLFVLHLCPYKYASDNVFSILATLSRLSNIYQLCVLDSTMIPKYPTLSPSDM